MSDPNPSLHIDTDWKKQAQEEKRRLAEQEKAKAADAEKAGASTATTAPTPPPGAPAAATPRDAKASARAQREVPPASFATLVHSIVTQALFYLGDLAPRGGEPVLNLDLAKHQIDLLGILEEKTANNLNPDEKRLLDSALYETRMRYISVASQFIS
jgi:hypothetical protein